MQSRFSKVVVILVAVVMLLSAVHTTTAQGGDYVKTFSLKLPAADGAYKGVDPKGAKVSFWHPYTGIPADAAKSLADKFNAENPFGITMTAVAKGSYDTIYQAMLAAIPTGDVPQLTVAYSNQAAQYQNVKALVNLDNFVKDPTLGFGKDFDTDFFQGYLSGDVNPQFSNQRLGMALYRSQEIMFYNVDALKKMNISAPPKTWDEFKTDACQYVKAGLGKDGYIVSLDASFVAAAAFGQGGDIYDAKNNKFTYNTPEAKAMPAVIQQMVADGCARTSTERFADQNSFIAQQSLFYTGTTSGLPFVAKGITDSGKTFAFDMAAIPYKDKPVQNIFGASVSIPKTKPEQELAAWLFIRWFDEPEQQAVWARASNYFPVRKSAAANLKDYFTQNKPYESAFNLLSNTKAEPPVAGYDPTRTDVAKAMSNIMDGASVDDEFAALDKAANKHLAENQPGSALPTPKPTAAATAAK